MRRGVDVFSHVECFVGYARDAIVSGSVKEVRVVLAYRVGVRLGGGSICGRVVAQGRVKGAYVVAVFQREFYDSGSNKDEMTIFFLQENRVSFRRAFCDTRGVYFEFVVANKNATVGHFKQEWRYHFVVVGVFINGHFGSIIIDFERVSSAIADFVNNTFSPQVAILLLLFLLRGIGNYTIAHFKCAIRIISSLAAIVYQFRPFVHMISVRFGNVFFPIISQFD